MLRPHTIQDYNSFSLIFFSKLPSELKVSRLEIQGLFKSNDYQILVYKDHMGAYCIFWVQASRNFDGVDLSSGSIITFLQHLRESYTHGPCAFISWEQNKAVSLGRCPTSLRTAGYAVIFRELTALIYIIISCSVSFCGWETNYVKIPNL